MIDPKDLETPPGFRRRKLHKASGRFRYVFTYANEKSTNDTHELRRAEEAKGKHAKFLQRATLRMVETEMRFSYLPPQWRWKFDFDSSRQSEYQRDSDAYFGEVRFRSPLEQVRDHLLFGGGPYFLRIDFENAFGAVTYDRFCEFTNDEWVRRNKYRFIPLSKHIYRGWPFFHRKEGGLIQGAATSPYLFERYCLNSELDDFLRTYAWRNKLTVTRYVDDVILSSSRPFGSKVRGTLRRAFDARGFVINTGKTKQVDVRNEVFEFLGVSLYKGKVSVNSKFVRGVEISGMTPSREAWLRQVEALNDI